MVNLLVQACCSAPWCPQICCRTLCVRYKIYWNGGKARRAMLKGADAASNDQLLLRFQTYCLYCVLVVKLSSSPPSQLLLLPRTLLPFIPPRPIPVPTCWAPTLPTPTFPRSAAPSRTNTENEPHTRRCVFTTRLRIWRLRAVPLLATVGGD